MAQASVTIVKYGKGDDGKDYAGQRMREVLIMNINKSTPVVSADEIKVAADPKIIWDAMAGIDHRPAWSP